MTDDAPALRDGEALVVPVDLEDGLALVFGIDPTAIGTPQPASRSLIDRYLQVAGYTGGANVARRLADGSLVRLAPETLERMREGATFAQSKGVAIGVLRNAENTKFAGPVRLLPGAANPVAAAMLVQTIAMQRQLQGIQVSLLRIDAKLEALHQAHHHEVLAGILARAKVLGDMQQKVAAGSPLSAQDETQLRQLEVDVQGYRIQARLWLNHLQPLLRGRRRPLEEQLQVLTNAFQNSHIAFWVRAAVASDAILVQLLTLKMERAAVAEEVSWAQELQAKARREIIEVGHGVHALHAGLDRYLRRNDIARGFEELSVRRKREVRHLRRQLWEVTNALRDAVAEATPMLESAMHSELPDLPEPLDRRAIEPHLVRDNTVDAAVQARQGATRGARSAKRGVQRAVERRRQPRHR